MLVLSRQKDESIVIGDDIEIIIVDVRGDKVRLGINAPREISVHRREIYDAIQREKQTGKTGKTGETGETGETGKTGTDDK
jgi:carbon storage regulator